MKGTKVLTLGTGRELYACDTQSFQQNRQFIFRALVALKMLVSLISRLVACSPRIVVDKQTDTHTERLL